MNRNRAAGDDHQCGEVERVKRDPGKHAATLYHVQRKTKNIRAISKFAFQPEMHPAEDEWKRDKRRNHATPHDQKVHGPTREAALKNEPLLDQIRGQRLCCAGSVLQKLFALQIEFPAATPVNTCRRSL